MKRLITGSHVVSWVASRTGEHGNYGAAVGIGVEENGAIRAGVVFSDWNGVNICMHVASDGSRNWMTRELLFECFRYAFETAGCRRITGLVGEGNKAAIDFDKHIGFSEEARLKGAHPDGDLIVFVMRKDDCRWLRRRDHVFKMAA